MWRTYGGKHGGAREVGPLRALQFQHANRIVRGRWVTDKKIHYYLQRSENYIFSLFFRGWVFERLPEWKIPLKTQGLKSSYIRNLTYRGLIRIYFTVYIFMTSPRQPLIVYIKRYLWDESSYLLFWSETQYSVLDLFQTKTSTFLHALSFECTSNLCINFLNQFSVYFQIKKMYYTIKSLNCVVHWKYFKNILRLFIKFTHSFVAIELLTFCKNAKKLFIAQMSSQYFG